MLVRWISKSIGASRDPPKGTLQLQTFNVSTETWTVQAFAPYDPVTQQPPAGLPESARTWFQTDEGKEWYFDPPPVATECSLDSDEDDLEDIQEMFAGTDPADPDSDNDGVRDGQESALGSDPLSGTATLKT